MVINNSGFRIQTGRTEASKLPNTAPKPVIKRSDQSACLSKNPRLSNPLTLVTDCIRTPTLFVAFATSAGIPININAGSVSIEPPPAKVLIKPDIIPVAINNVVSSRPSGDRKKATSNKVRIQRISGRHGTPCNRPREVYYSRPMGPIQNKKRIAMALSTKIKASCTRYYFFINS
jgi:hypothetical protein